MNFATSTQRQRWLFTETELDNMRQAAREKSLAMLSQLPESPEPISLEEQTLLLKFYQMKIQSVCRELRLPRKLLNTALTYVKRFYMTFSALDHDPQFVVLTCVYLACKTEECYISAAELGRLSGVPAEALLRFELTVLQGLKFDLLIHPPYKAIEGFLMELGTELTQAQIAKVKNGAYETLDRLLLTDANLIYTPGQLGLAAYQRALQAAGASTDVAALLQQALEKAPQTSDAADKSGISAQLQEILSAVNALLDAENANDAPPQDQVAAIDRKLKAWMKAKPAVACGAGQADKAGKKAARRAAEKRKLEEDVGVIGDA